MVLNMVGESRAQADAEISPGLGGRSVPDQKPPTVGGQPGAVPTPMSHVRTHNSHVSGAAGDGDWPAVLDPEEAQQATTMTFLGMIAGQIGTAFAARTQRASLRSVGVFSNRYLLAGIAAEIMLAAVFVYTPALQALLGTAALPASDLVILLPYPFVVRSADELLRYLARRCDSTPQHRASPQSRASTSQPGGGECR